MEEQETTLVPARSAFMTAVQLLEATRASLLLRDGSGSTLTVADSVGIDTDLASSIRVQVGQGIAGVVAEQGVALFGEIGDETFLSVPVVTDRGVEGVLNVTARTGGKKYSAGDITLATSVGKHIGQLLQYSRYAARDAVSGLPNRRAFNEALRRELALSDRTGSPFTVAFLDLDNLKDINDRLGHAKGDEVIARVGEALKHILRPYDFAGRYGGDEFVLLLSGTGGPDAHVTHRIADVLDAVSAEMGIEVSASVGTASCPEDGKTSSELLALADDRMYRQKRAKKGLK